ncbi:MAG: GerW family sporulation protein [Wujia sp.]
MMASDFNQTVGSLFKGMDSLLTTKTVVGEPTKVGDTIILPLVDVNFGVGAGAFAKNASNSAGGGMGGKMSPTAVLVIQNGHAKMIPVKQGDTVSKVLDMIPDLVDKVGALLNKKDEDDSEVQEAIESLSKEEDI